MTQVKTRAGSQTVARALAVLELLGTKGEMGVRDIARSLDIAPSMAQRIVNTLSLASFIEKDDQTSRWKIGYKMFRIGSVFLSSTDLNAAASPELRDLAKHEVNAFLGVLRNRSVVYLATVQSSATITISNLPGSATYLHSTALGKVMLAALPDGEVAQILGPQPYRRLTRNTRRTLSSLMKDLQKCRRFGYAVCDEENIDNVYAIGAPIYNVSGQVIAALSGAMPRQNLSARVKSDLCRQVREAAARTSHRLGYLG